MRIRNLLPSSALLVLALLTLAAPASRAGYVFTFLLDSNVMNGIPGGEAVFSGTLIFDGDPDPEIFLNDIAVTFTIPGDVYLTNDLQYFLDHVNGDLLDDGLPGHNTYIGPIFKVNIAPNTPFGTYFGSIDILGGVNGPFADFDVIANQLFQVNVVTPEPGGWGLTMAGLAVVMGAVRRRRMR